MHFPPGFAFFLHYLADWQRILTYKKLSWPAPVRHALTEQWNNLFRCFPPRNTDNRMPVGAQQLLRLPNNDRPNFGHRERYVKRTLTDNFQRYDRILHTVTGKGFAGANTLLIYVRLAESREEVYLDIRNFGLSINTLYEIVQARNFSTRSHWAVWQWTVPPEIWAQGPVIDDDTNWDKAYPKGADMFPNLVQQNDSHGTTKKKCS